MTRNFCSDEHSHSGHGVGFGKSSSFALLSGGGFGKNVIIFGVDNSSSAYADSRKKTPQFLVKPQHMD